MNFFYIINGRKLKRYALIGIALLFSLGVVYIEKDNISVFSYQEPAAVYSVITEKKVLALTFDISWGDKRAEPILDTLKANNVSKATFFLSSPWSKSHPEIVKQIVDSGYEIGSHGHKHVNYSQLNAEEIRKQLRTAHAILSETTGQTPKLLRLPNGDFDKRVLAAAHDMGYTVIQWDTDSLDWLNKGVDHIVEQVVGKAHPGDIVLMHASDSSRQTHLALPEIIEKLRNKGYEFVTVSELLAITDVKGNTAEDQ